MMYFFLFFILIILSINYEITGFKKGKNFLIFTIIFILAFNYQMGTDWIPYQYFYENIVPKISFFDIFFNKNISYEKGYILLNFIFYNMGFNYEIFMGTLLSVCIYILLKVIYKKSDNYYLSFTIFIMSYLLVNTLEPVIRQLIAIVIVTYAFGYIEKRKFFNYLIFIILAFFFHKSAIIGIFMYFFPLLKIKLKYIILISIFIYLSILTLPFIMEIGSKVIPSLSKYSNYFNNIRYGVSRERSLLKSFYHLIISCGYIYIIFYCYEYSEKKSDLYKNMAIIYILINYFQYLLPILYRINQYFVLGFSICMGSVAMLHFTGDNFVKFTSKKLKVLYVIFLYIPFSLSFWRMSSTELNRVRYFNYKNYFIEMIKGNLKKDFKEKSEDYEKIIEKLIKKENNTLRKG